MISKQTTLAGVILAGGQARRMDNADKGLVNLNDKPLVSYIISALSQVVDNIYISANRNVKSYENLGYPVITDQTQDFSGPLAGILSAMHTTQAEILLVVPCDSPLIKAQHLQQLLNTLSIKEIDATVAFDGERLHPVFLALNTSLKDSLAIYLASGERKVETWLKQQRWGITDLSDDKAVFTNINTYEELATLEAQLKLYQ
jgi:molybdopterin-guanine dinucleotide biosynthesis protein A